MAINCFATDMPDLTKTAKSDMDRTPEKSMNYTDLHAEGVAEALIELGQLVEEVKNKNLFAPGSHANITEEQVKLRYAMERLQHVMVQYSAMRCHRL